MKTFARLLLPMLVALLLAACSSAVGTDARLAVPIEHKAEVIGAVSYGP